MLFQFFVNKCTHKIDTLYNTQPKKKHLYCRQFFWCDNQQTTTTNNKKQNKKKTKKTKKNKKTIKKKTIEQYRKQRDNNHKFRGEISDDAQDFSNRRRIILK